MSKLNKYTKPNGTPRKVMGILLAKEYGWSARSDLNNLIIKTYKNFVEINKKETIYNVFF